MKKYHVIFPNPNGEGNRIYGLVKTETMGLRMARMGKWGGVMKQTILKLENSSKYVNGTYITIIGEDEIETFRHKILQIIPLDSGKFLIERTYR